MHYLFSLLTAVLFMILLSIQACEHSQADSAGAPGLTDAEMVARGKYLVQIGGCNDCHAVGYAESEGKLPESEWLTGSPVGFQGPWGTTYASNLRLTVKNMDENAFVQMCKTRTGMPPMPWPSLNSMTEEDLRSLYRYLTKLGPKGTPAPLIVAAGQEPATPYIEFVPKHLERLTP